MTQDWPIDNIGWLFALVMADALLAGYRAGAGRNPLLHKTDYYIKGFWMGAAGGVAAALVVAAIALGMGTWHIKAGMPWSEYLAELNHAAGVLVKPYAFFAAVMLAVVVFWSYPVRRVRELSAVLILGPCTLLRPFVILGGAMFAAWHVPPHLVALVFIAVGVHLAMEAALNRIAHIALLRNLKRWEGNPHARSGA